LHLTLEFFQVTSFGLVAYIFSFSTIRQYNRTRESRRPLVISFVIYYVIVVVTFGFAVFPDFLNKNCSNIPWLALSVEQFFFAFLFAVLALIILRMLSTHKIQATKHHTQPLLTMVIIYAFISGVSLLFRIFLYFTRDIVCIGTLDARPENWQGWLFLLYRIIDLHLPIWSILWYCYKTVVPKDYEQTYDQLDPISTLTLTNAGDSAKSFPELKFKQENGGSYNLGSQNFSSNYDSYDHGGSDTVMVGVGMEYDEEDESMEEYTYTALRKH